MTQVLTAAVACGCGTEVDFVRDELSCDLRRNIFSLTTPTHKLTLCAAVFWNTTLVSLTMGV
jgi:hypothetical protein